MNTQFEMLLLSELRIVIYDDRASCVSEDDADNEVPTITDIQMVQAVTANEELMHLGYTLRPADLIRLAASPSLTGFAEHFRSLLPDVTAPPMYPDFPKQVMEMDEAEFRLHQMIHYFSTYGLEMLLGDEVQKGWLPQEHETPKTRRDETLLKAKVLELVPAQQAAMTAIRRVLGKRERMNSPEAEMIRCAVTDVQPKDLASVQVPFKENLVELFDAILCSDAGAERVLYWRGICQHTGDVIKCVRSILPRHHYHFRTSQKRAVVKLLESYPAQDLKTNLILSAKKREQNLVVLQFIDYNMYSRSDDHREAVRALRSGELRSWQARADHLITSGDEGALDYIAKRPGMLLRMIRWLLRAGYPYEAVHDKLVENAACLSLKTIVSTLNALDAAQAHKPVESLYRLEYDKIKENGQNRLNALRRSFSSETITSKYERRRLYVKECYEKLRLVVRKIGPYDICNRIGTPEQVDARYRRILENLQAMEKWERDPQIREHRMRNAEHEERQRRADYARKYQEACERWEKNQPYEDRVRTILLDAMRAHLQQIRTELFGQKVCLQMQDYDLAWSALKADEGTSEGGYLPAGIAVRIPERVKYLRFFVYWNDPKRVDLDLHARAFDPDGNMIEVGWNADFKKNGIIHSGDITHSDAAEYIDIDLAAPLCCAETNIDLYHGKRAFHEIETCYVGMMAVRDIGEDVKLYDPKNCFFTHTLRSDTNFVYYGYVDVARRLLFFVGRRPYELPSYIERSGQMYRDRAPFLSMERYLAMLLDAQQVTLTHSPQEADVVLTIERSAQEKAVSLVDRNFYLEA